MKYIKYDEFTKNINEEITKCGETDHFNTPVSYGITLGLKIAQAYANVLTVEVSKDD